MPVIQRTAEELNIKEKEKEKEKVREVLTHVLYGVDGGLLVLVELIRNYDEVEDCVLSENSQDLPPLSDFYSNDALKAAYLNLGGSNAITMPAWRRIGIPGTVWGSLKANARDFDMKAMLLHSGQDPYTVSLNSESLMTFLYSVEITSAGETTDIETELASLCDALLSEWESMSLSLMRFQRACYINGLLVTPPSGKEIIHKYPELKNFARIYQLEKLFVTLQLVQIAIDSLGINVDEIRDVDSIELTPAEVISLAEDEVNRQYDLEIGRT